MQLHTCTYHCPQNLLLQRMCACLQPRALSLLGLQISFSKRAEWTSCLSINNFLKLGFFFHFTLAAKLKHKNNIIFYSFFTSFDLQLRCLLVSSTFLSNARPANAVLIETERGLWWALTFFINFLHWQFQTWIWCVRVLTLSYLPSTSSTTPSNPIFHIYVILFCLVNHSQLCEHDLWTMHWILVRKRCWLHFP